MQPFRFVHAADLHLDAPFRGLSFDSEDLGGKLRQATFSAFENLIELCLSVQADFLLVAGDVYNQEDRSLRAQLRFREGLAKLADHGLAVFVVHGNHDPAGSASRALQWPEQVRVFDSDQPECVPVVRDGTSLALVHGASHCRSRETRNLARRFQRDRRDLFQIGLLHCNLGRNTGHEPYAPCDLKDLTDSGLDYWALGHVHAGCVWSRDPHVVYPGNIQGLNVTEAGPRGCYVVDVQSDRTAELAFHPLDAVRWVCIQVDIAECTSLDRLEEAVLNRIEDWREEAGNRGLICRIVLRGRGPLHNLISGEEGQDDLLQRFREQFSLAEPFVWIKDVRVDTGSDIDLDERRRQQDFLGEVLAQAKGLRDRGDRLELLHQEVLSELFGHRRAGKCLQGLSQAEADELIGRAEFLCVDLLEQNPPD